MPHNQQKIKKVVTPSIDHSTEIDYNPIDLIWTVYVGVRNEEI